MDSRQIKLPFTDFDLNNITRAKVLAETTHINQKYGDMPYILHCKAVVDVLIATGFNTPEHIQVGWLHDCIEDADDKDNVQNFIQRYFSEEVYNAVIAITKRHDENYEEYIPRVCANTLALEVKIADNTVNMRNSMWEYMKNKTPENYCRLTKYGKIRTALERAYFGEEDFDFSYDPDEDYYPEDFGNVGEN